MNDCVNGQEKLCHADIYEFAFSYYDTQEYGQLQAYLYTAGPRDNVDALFYGHPLPTQALSVPAGNMHNPDAGFTIIRHAPGRSVCIKNSPYGGEHDHYDRLNLIVFNNYTTS